MNEFPSKENFQINDDKISSAMYTPAMENPYRAHLMSQEMAQTIRKMSLSMSDGMTDLAENNINFITIEKEPKTKDIHNAVNNIENVILDEVNAILGDVSKDEINEYKKIEEYGFESLDISKKVTIINEYEAKIEESLSLSNHYKKVYGKKFLTQKMIDFICVKYQLYFGDAKRFTYPIPPKSRKDIISFIEKDIKKEDLHGLSSYGGKQHIGFYVIAPSNMFNFANSSVNKNNKIEDAPLDPIVLYPVNKGYLVITMWGDEEDINELKNKEN